MKCVARRGLTVAAACLVVCWAGTGLCRGGSVEQNIEKLVANLNKCLPQQIDEFTRLDRVEAGPGKSYSYFYTINKDLTDSEKENVRQATTQRALASPEMRPIFASGVTVWYKYYDVEGNSVLEFSVSGGAKSEEDEAYEKEQTIGYHLGVFGGALLIGVLCGLLPLYLGIRRGNSKLAFVAMVCCVAAGLILGIWLAVPAAVIFIVVVLATPRIVPESAVVKTDSEEETTL